MPSTLHVPIEGMSCVACAEKIQKRLKTETGVLDAAVNFATREAQITGDLNLKGVVEAVQDVGFDVPLHTQRFRIEGMHCASCVQSVEDAVAAIPGVIEAGVNLAAEDLRVRAVEAINLETVQRAVAGVGYRAIPEAEDVEVRDEALYWRRRFFMALPLAALLVLAMFREQIPSLAEVDSGVWSLGLLALCLPVYLYGGWPFHRSAWKGLRHSSVDMNTLVSLGTTAAFVYSLAMTLAPGLAGQGSSAVYYDTAAVIIAFLLLGRWLETRARHRASRAVQELLVMQPPTANRLVDEKEETVPVDLLKAGDHVRVKSGEKLPVDGVVVEGESEIDESLLTGESAPVLRRVNDDVFGGSINGHGSLVVRVTKLGHESVLGRMVAMVREAQMRKAPIQSLADQVASVFVPIVLAIAAVTFVAWMVLSDVGLSASLLRAVSVLVIACPCALGLATPVAILVGTGRGADLGILFKGGDVVEHLAKAKRVFFDKTGTLTQGAPRVTTVSPVMGVDEETLLGFAAAVETGSEHPLARAILEHAKGIAIPEARLFRARTGQGVEARIDGIKVRLGTEAWLQEEGIDTSSAAAPARQNRTPLFLAHGERFLGTISVEDALRAEASRAVAALDKLGLEVNLLSGDRRSVVEAIALEAGISRTIAEASPKDKLAAVEGEGTVMVGDGMNDAPALAAASVGIAMGQGTGVALESAPVVLLHEDLRAVPRAIELARQTLSVIRQNLVWAFLFNLLGIPLAAGVFYPVFGWSLHPMFAAGAMALSSVLVVTNALRLRRFRTAY